MNVHYFHHPIAACLLLATPAVPTQHSGFLIFFCALGIVAGLSLSYRGYLLLQKRNLILNTPVSKIRNAAVGMVELSGVASGPFTLIAPLTERSCYYYRSAVWEWKLQGSTDQWVKIASECMHVPFFLDDSSGKVMVDPRGAELDLHCDFQREFSEGFFTTKQQAPPNVTALLTRHGISTTNKIKVEEFCIKPKNALFILGTLTANAGLELTANPTQDDDHNTLTLGNNLWSQSLGSMLSAQVLSARSDATNDDHSPPQSFAPSVSQRLFGGISSPASSQPDSIRPASAQLSGNKEVQLYGIATLNPPDETEIPQESSLHSADAGEQERIAAVLAKAGIINPAAWAAAGATNPTDHANNSAISTDGFETKPAVVLNKGKSNKTFLISWRSRRELAASLGWKYLLMICGGPALALLSLYGFLASVR